VQLSDDQIKRYLDVDFGTAAAANGRMCGAKPRVEPVGGAGIQTYASYLRAAGLGMLSGDDREAIIDKYTREGWPQRKLSPYMHDQNGEPSCVSNAKLLCHEILQAQQFGIENVTVLSPISLYRFVGSRSSGSSLSENLRRMKSHGALPLDNERNRAMYKHVHPHNGYGKEMPSGWEETGKLFMDCEYADINDWEEFQDALCRGFPVMYARSGHCITGVSVTKSSSGKTLDYQNSWGLDWGNPTSETLNGGLGHDSERTARSASGGAIAVINVKIPFTTL
jgi:hypothetical protein